MESESLDLALLRFLEELVYYKDTEQLLLRPAGVAVVQRDGRWVIDGSLEGEFIDASRHELCADVKAVTLHRLEVRRANGSWEATVVLDI